MGFGYRQSCNEMLERQRRRWVSTPTSRSLVRQRREQSRIQLANAASNLAGDRLCSVLLRAGGSNTLGLTASTIENATGSRGRIGGGCERCLLRGREDVPS